MHKMITNHAGSLKSQILSLHCIKKAMTLRLHAGRLHVFYGLLLLTWPYTLKPKCFTTVSTVASAYLIIKLVHGHWGHGVAVGLCPIPMAVLGVNPMAGFRVELRVVLAVPLLTGGHHIHLPGPRRNPSLVWRSRRGWRLAMHSPFCKEPNYFSRRGAGNE